MDTTAIVDREVMRSALREHFGFESFRPLQEEIVSGVVAGHDAFVLMPTGGGKSLCYQLPALLLDGLTVVVSPLIALMKDQVDALCENGIAATYINSTLSTSEVAERRERLVRGEIKLLYLAPERLALGDFVSFLGRLRIALFAIDEAHCISEWGHDFRRDYRQLSMLRTRFPSVPIVAMTATANARVQSDIIEQLKLRDDALQFQASFDRANLYYGVRQKEKGIGHILDFVASHRGESGILYCGSRTKCEELAEALAASGHRALPYHAGLDSETRSFNQEQFVRDNVEIVCATIAFGMGIDKPDVRYVLHVDMPKNLMSYYQETGRAGRDGLPSECILYSSPGDRSRIMRFIYEKPDPVERQIATAQLDEMIAFAESADCRRRVVLAHFGESYPQSSCGNCDNCLDPGAIQEHDATRHAQMFLSCIARLRQRYGAGHVIDVLRGSQSARVMEGRHHELSTYGIGMELTKEEWRSISYALLNAGYLEQDPRTDALHITESGWLLLKGERTLTIRRRRKEPVTPRRRSRLGLMPMNRELYERLRVLRKQIADQHDVAAYMVFGDKTLMEMAAHMPRSHEEFRSIHGVGDAKARHYADIFLSEIARYLEGSNEPAPVIDTPPPVPREYEPPARTATATATLYLYREGMSIEQIAAERGRSLGTILGHLEPFIACGDIDNLDRVMDPDKVVEVEAAFDEHGIDALKPVFDQLGGSVSYDELRLVRAWMWRSKNR